MRTLIAALLAIGLSVGVPAAQEAARPASVQATVGSPVNLNTATATQLESLPGIGPATAKRIVDYRQQNGGFKRVEEILEIHRSVPDSLNVSSYAAPAAVSRSR